MEQAVCLGIRFHREWKRERRPEMGLHSKWNPEIAVLGPAEKESLRRPLRSWIGQLCQEELQGPLMGGLPRFGSVDVILLLQKQ